MMAKSAQTTGETPAADQSVIRAPNAPRASAQARARRRCSEALPAPCTSSTVSSQRRGRLKPRKLAVTATREVRADRSRRVPQVNTTLPYQTAAHQMQRNGLAIATIAILRMLDCIGVDRQSMRRSPMAGATLALAGAPVHHAPHLGAHPATLDMQHTKSNLRATIEHM